MARQRKLSPERKKFINSLIEHYHPEDVEDVQEMLKDLLGDTLQGMLEAEMDDKLGYSKYDYKNKETDDSRNGFSKKTVTSTGCVFFDEKVIEAVGTWAEIARLVPVSVKLALSPRFRV